MKKDIVGLIISMFGGLMMMSSVLMGIYMVGWSDTAIVFWTSILVTVFGFFIGLSLFWTGQAYSEGKIKLRGRSEMND